MSKKGFATFVKNKRKEKNLTREELAERLNTTYAVVYKWETGVRYPDFEMIGQLAKELDVSVQELYDSSTYNDDDDIKSKVIISTILIVLFAFACVNAFMHGGKTRGDFGAATSVYEETKGEESQEEEVITADKPIDDYAKGEEEAASENQSGTEYEKNKYGFIMSETIPVDEGYWMENNGILYRFKSDGEMYQLKDVWETNEYGKEVYFDTEGKQILTKNETGAEVKYDYVPLGLRKLSDEQKKEYENLLGMERKGFCSYVYAKELLLGRAEPIKERLSLEKINELLEENNGDIYETFKRIEELQPYPDCSGGSGVTLLEYWFDDYGDEKLTVSMLKNYNEELQVFDFYYDKREHVEGVEPWQLDGFNKENSKHWDAEKHEWDND